MERTPSPSTGGGKHQSFRIEMRDASGKVSGRFGYVDPAGALHITEYQADSGGYRLVMLGCFPRDLPVGAPRHQYPTAPLLQLPQRPKSYPA